ncbi:TauD/TfdA family dioxygenase [Pseudoalteromonas rubra]|uniref:TauD/TfdA family dioxygenase n=1 Tax=Pseudoalteromonas rubra TaxID=43658 RepID=A0A5S3WNP6_9GAMM|nr:TauD/TfdA family dioxygenase [Pseudoalteromonas rubra]TMP29962.1 TauD/TfdA family dioxygenase [Pseudoalteromonas rubra]TMP32190.1 TauD/TfdA family dioxygenase [Pseudoalteromonas rubra]
MKFNAWKEQQEKSEIVAQPPEEAGLPVIFDANVRRTNLVNWVCEHKSKVKSELRRYGAVLFRRFDVGAVEGFEDFVTEMVDQTGQYTEGATPRSHVGKGVYTSTEFPQEQEIFLHNELSYVLTPPALLAFYCVTSASKGGQTQLADVRKVLSLIDPAVIEEFKHRGGWSLYRSFGFGMGPSIHKSFGTDDPASLAAYCKQANIEILDHTGSTLKTRQCRPVVHQHPETNEDVWFNHAVFWHPSSLPEEFQATLAKSFKLTDFPFVTLYGDGTPIPDDVIGHIRDAYRQAEVMFDWKAGDVLLLDNKLVAHGRKPFSGDRRVLVAMG